MLRQIRAIRRYATLADPHARFHLHPWPNGSPTPEQIFRGATSKNELKAMYQKYVKIYHPDMSTVVHDHQNQVLTPEGKRDRFDQIQHAYEALKNGRGAYSGPRPNPWGGAQATTGRLANQQHFYRHYANSKAFHQAGTWEDYYRMRFNRDPPTQEEIDKNKYSILIGVLLVAALTTSLQVMLAFDKSRQYTRETAIINLQSMQSLDASYNNYDQGLSPLLRLRRFLLYRRTGIDGDTEAMKSEEDEILRNYARKRLSRLEPPTFGNDFKHFHSSMLALPPGRDE